MKRIAFLFPGQGSQAVGMGADLFAAHAGARDIFDMAESVSRLPIRKLCFEGPMETLTETVNLQPALTAVNLACLRLIRDAGITPVVTAGHSLGEFSALCAAGVVSEGDALALVFRRGELMHREATRHQGAMTALIGLFIDEVEPLTAEGRELGTVSVANHNAEKQIVITGAPAAVARVGELAAAKKAKAIPLKVSGAWHSELIRGAETEFREYLATIAFRTPECPVIHNVTADAAAAPDTIRELMARQLCSPVRWYDGVNRILAENVEAFVEVGPGKVLTGLLRKHLPKGTAMEIHNVFDRPSLEAFLTAMA